ncbi:MaoC family dehydratase [Bacillaceae bacterium IKA-2]|nr:MaoC family dehydratase [Bacillaceae bacterium IKA-2]
MNKEKPQYFKLLEQSKTINEISFNEIIVGDSDSFTRTVTSQDVLDFATLTEDVNPIHIDEEFAENTMFKGRIAHGMLTAAFISTLLGTILPGKNVIYLSQSCKFIAPVRIGDTLKVVGEVIKKQENKKLLTIQTNIYNQKGKLVLEGIAIVMKNEQS